ncbi:MAG TPA: hypothetical protein VIR81_13320, partial [Myxococcales bacterium]
MARKKGGRGPGQGGTQPPRPQGGGAAAAGGGGGAGGGWTPLRDSIRRDVEQAISSLAFAQRLHQKLETQRRAFLDFPRVMEQLRSGAFERLTGALSRLYEGGQGFDLQRFLRDLPLALAQLAAADKNRTQPPPPQADASAPSAPPAAPDAAPASESTPPPEAAPASEAAATTGAVPSAEAAPAAPAETANANPNANANPEPQTAPISPRLELRAKLLTAAPNLAKAAQSYRRNVATLRRASLPRRSPGPWRADREVLEEAHRAVEFVQKLYDAYAEAWADQPLTRNLADQTAAELDRFLAWTQLDRYVELAVLASTTAHKPAKPGQHVISAPHEHAPVEPPVTEASPGAVAATPDAGPAAEEKAAEPAAE